MRLVLRRGVATAWAMLTDSTEEFDKRLDLRVGVATAVRGACDCTLAIDLLVNLRVVLEVDESD